MTVQYNGGGNYTIFIEHREFILSKAEIDVIQSYDFIREESTESVEILQDRIEDLEGISEELKTAESTIETLVEDIQVLEQEIYILRKELEE